MASIIKSDGKYYSLTINSQTLLSCRALILNVIMPLHKNSSLKMQASPTYSRFVKIASLVFPFSPLAKFVALAKRHPTA